MIYIIKKKTVACGHWLDHKLNYRITYKHCKQNNKETMKQQENKT